MKLKMRTMTAITSKAWMSAPPTCIVKPSSHTNYYGLVFGGQSKLEDNRGGAHPR